MVQLNRKMQEIMMENLSIEQWMEKYPYLKNVAEYTIFTTPDDIKIIKNSEKIKIDGQEVSVDFLKRLLQDDYYYDYASRFFNNDVSKFDICYIISGDIAGRINYQKLQIIKGIEQLISSNKLVLQPEEKQKYEKLKEKISFERFLEKNKGNNYNIDI